MQQIGPYTVLEELARGGQGVVYRARDADGCVVALKLLLAQRAESERARKRFQIEVQTLTRLEHPNVVPILATGEHEGAPWLALTYVEGESLEERLRRGPLPIHEAIRVAQQLAQALSYVHGCGVLHRDLKPDNVLLRGDQALLTDFGLALDVDGAGTRITASGGFMGTPGYWPPEQARGLAAELGPRSDVYGLGAVLYACLTARPPVQAKSFQDFFKSAQFKSTPPPSEERAEVPSWLSALCMSCLAMDPAQRPASPDEVARALSARDPRTSHGRSARVGLTAGAAVLLLACAVAWAASRADPPLSDATPSPVPTEQPAPEGDVEEPATLPAIPFELPASVSSSPAGALGAFADGALFTLTSDELRVWSGRGLAPEHSVELPTGPRGSSWRAAAVLPLSRERSLIGRDGIELCEWTPAGVRPHELRGVHVLARHGAHVAYGLTSGELGVLEVGAQTLRVGPAAVDLGDGRSEIQGLAWLSPSRIVALARRRLRFSGSNPVLEADREAQSEVLLLSFESGSGRLALLDSKPLPGAYCVAVSGTEPSTIVVGTAIGNLFLWNLESGSEQEALASVGSDYREPGAPTTCRDLVFVSDTLCLGALDVRQDTVNKEAVKRFQHLNGVLVYDVTDRRPRVFPVPEVGPRRLAFDPTTQQVVVLGERGGARVFSLQTILEGAEPLGD